MFMFILVKILALVYIVAVNVYSLLLTKYQKNARDNDEDSIRDVRLYVTAFLGGGLGIYLAMFIFKYRLKNFMLMVTMPLLIAAYVYLIVIGFINDFWF